jgi:hypothetical protein
VSPKINSATLDNRPPGHYYRGERIDYRPGETFGEAILRHQKARASKPTAMAQPEPAEPDRRAAQDANGKELKALADEPAELRAMVDIQSPAAPPSEPEPKRTGFASKIKVAGGSFNAFGKHEQRKGT